MERVKKHLGFGCMRLPMAGDQVDTGEMNRMVDAFLAAGYNYFDTAHGYHDGRSETALRECLTSRYPRERYILTNKLTNFYFETEADIRPFFQQQLDWCGVDYFDFYLMHSQSKEIFEKFQACRAYETALALKAEGKLRRFGISFHDRAEVLEQILTRYPEVEVVQLQINYVDWDDPAVQSRKCLEVCQRHGKPVIVMEPLKGGSLVHLPPAAQAVLDDLHGGSAASYALRFAAGCDGVFLTLSGMSDLAQLQENLQVMDCFTPLDDREQEAIRQVCQVFRDLGMISCTACRYCTAGCPKNISIPDLFACMNAKQIFHDWNADYYYETVHTVRNGKASDCVQCGRCEAACPQHLPIRDLLGRVAAEFEPKTPS